jgi:hypothetical protein
MGNKEKLRELIEKSNLSEEDKASWDFLIENSSENFIESLSEILEQFPEELIWFNDIYNRKKAAFAILKENKSEGEMILKNICEEEKKKLETLLSK